MIEWFMTLFTRNLHIDLAVRIWDVYMIDGIATLYKAAIGIIVNTNIIYSHTTILRETIPGDGFR